MQKKLLVIAGSLLLIFALAWFAMRRSSDASRSSAPAPTPKWTIQLGKIKTALALGADETVYSIDQGGILVAVSPSGEVQCRYELGRVGIGAAPAVGVDGMIYVVALGKLVIVDPSGELKQEHKIEARAGDGIALTPSRVFGACSRDEACAWSLDPYVELVWKISLGQNQAAPLLHGYTRTMIAWNAVLALGTSVSPPLWSYPETAELVESRQPNEFNVRGRFNSLFARAFAGASDGTTYVVAHTGLIALAEDGSKKWEFSASGHGFAQPVVAASGTIYFLGDGRLNALYAEDGRKQWHLYARGAVGQPLLGAGGTIFFTQGDSLRAVGPDGKEKWRAKLDGEAPGQATLSSDGTLYVATEKGTLYAFPVGESLMPSAWPKYQGNVRNSGQVNP